MKYLLLFIVLLFTCALAWAAPLDEFTGPFASWRSVKDYGAKGNGVDDDTNAIQLALDDLRFHKEFCVLYFPAGTYRITNTVSTLRKAHQEGMGMTVIGEDPAKTIIKWDGPDGGIMFKYDAWYSKISRLTLDGAGKAGVALAYGDAFSTYNETSDMIFKDVVTGMSMATGGNGQAENAVLRCQFLHCSGAGLRTNNFNSLDIWAWYCRFEDCGYGLYNGAGNFHAYGCLFLRSKKMDIGTANLMVFAFVNNTSIGSNSFLDFASQHTWGSACSITGNRIINPTGPFPLRLGNAGPYLVMDNTIVAREGVTDPVAYMTWSDQVFVGNTYTVKNPVKEAGRRLLLDEKVIARDNIDISEPKLPPTPPKVARKVFDVPAGATADAIQAAIDEACKLKGQRPVVHLPQGNYKIAKTLTIPAGCDVQLVGDGAAETATVLQWAGEAGGILLKLQGPSVAVIRDLSLNNANGNNLVIENCDQPGGKIYGNQCNLSAMSPNAKAAGLLVDGLEQTDVQMDNLQGATFCSTWVKVNGGPNLQAGKPVKNQVNVYCGATGTADAQYAVTNGGRLVVRTVYHEMSGEAAQGILLNDRGSLFVDSTRFSYKTSATSPLIKAENFQGRFAITTNLLLPVNSTFTTRIEAEGDGAKANLLSLCNDYWVNEPGVDADKVLINRAAPPAKMSMLYCNTNSGTKDVKPFFDLDNRGPADEAFLLEMLKPLREARIWLPETNKPGITNVLLHRVICAAGGNGVDIELKAK